MGESGVLPLFWLPGRASDRAKRTRACTVGSTRQEHPLANAQGITVCSDRTPAVVSIGANPRPRFCEDRRWKTPGCSPRLARHYYSPQERLDRFSIYIACPGGLKNNYSIGRGTSTAR